MKTYTVIVNEEAVSDLNDIAVYIASIYRPESGHIYVNRILGQLASLSYTADIYQKSRFAVAKKSTPNPKQHPSSIIDRRWCFTLMAITL